MKKILRLIPILLLTMLSCGNRTILTKLDKIKSVGDKKPRVAMRMLDSLDIAVRSEPEYIQMRYDLLGIRLHDMANIQATSDLKIKGIVVYFEKEGTERDLQEAYYYAGSTYRDLHDTPRALENFAKSVATASESRSCDKVMLRNAYSNMQYLYYKVQDYRNALAMAKKELALSRQLGNIQINSILHLGNSYLALDSTRQAMNCFDQTLSLAKRQKSPTRAKALCVLLCNYSLLGEKASASECHSLLDGADSTRQEPSCSNALGTYFRSIGNTPAAIACYQRTMTDGKDEYSMYDAAKALFRLYNAEGDAAAANAYASKFIELSERLDLGKRQELAATINNEFQYHLDQERLQKAERDRRIYMRMVGSVLFLAVVMALSFYIFYMKRKNAALRKNIALANKLNSVIDQKAAMQEGYTADLKKANEKIEEKTRQSQTLMKMLHRSEMASKAEDIIQSVRDAAKGKRRLDEENWKELYKAVDELYPQFNETLVERLGKFSEQQMQVAYLMRIGLNNPQINNVTDISRSTIWRWTNALGWINEPQD